MKNIIIKLTLALVCCVLITSCNKEFLETEPTNQVSADLAVETTANGMILLNGLHRSMYHKFYTRIIFNGIGSQLIINDLAGDDFVDTGSNNTWTTVYQWTASTSDTDLFSDFAWKFYYHLVANANILINGIDGATGTQDERDYIKGQALVYRAFAHYQLVQLFAERYNSEADNKQLGVPYKLNTDELLVPRETVENVYSLLNTDLDLAIKLLEVEGRLNKSHINQSVALGIKARVALTQGNWDVAITNATMAHEGFALMNQSTYAEGFTSDSESNPEFMWASQIIAGDQAIPFSDYGAWVSRNFNGNAVRGNPRAITKVLYDKIADSDVRKTLWDPTGLHPDVELTDNHSRHPYTNQKFLVADIADSRIDIPLMRAAEMYLIIAEANARKGGADGLAAQALFDLASTRDLEYSLSINTGQALIDEIMVQRRVELWGEGFRFYDLKRLNQDLVREVGLADTGTHQASFIGNVSFVPAGDKRWVFLIPKSEIDANPLVEQNPL
ncbi:RagB/SusD family nutrient uptake outer membrane protein [Zobellia nedashkovskayae]|uniref:RagB/SusD family nutrient uptake outer membrane protein n=1 Tax=Zobellia nedashkovskayae TaxID=2779510 RepID=UPI00188D2FDE|nr:RagB/SusD family nutrient uptake outer membrane protein [Zobellia nedashkovskayae]